MIIFPAIDLLDGKVVRLEKGDYQKSTTFSEDPASVAEEMYRKGASWIHIVDLDGAKEGQPKNLKSVYHIAQNLPLRIQFGGGLRSILHIEDSFEAGISRAVISTKAFNDKKFLSLVSSSYPEDIAISIDARGDTVCTKGWREDTDLKIKDAFKLLKKYNVPHIIFTDIEKDGMETGIDIDRIKDILAQSPSPVTIAGGISTMKDLENLFQLRNLNLEGAIIGKAYYKKLIDLKTAIEQFQSEEESL